MSHKRQVIEEKRGGAPAYLVTFSALVTLLMLFFALLLTMTTTQGGGGLGKGRYAATQESFLRSIRTFGLGVLYRRKTTPDFGNIKIKYFISNPDKQFEGRTIDAKEENIRRLFKKVTQSTKSTPSQIVAETTKFSITDIHFPTGDATLNDSAKKFLTQFTLDLQQDSNAREIKLYVLGLASEEMTEKKQWIVSARRAQAVSDFLNDALPSESQWPVYSWGAGPGGYWVSHDGLISKQSQILIAVLRTND